MWTPFRMYSYNYFTQTMNLIINRKIPIPLIGINQSSSSSVAQFTLLSLLWLDDVMLQSKQCKNVPEYTLKKLSTRGKLTQHEGNRIIHFVANKVFPDPTNATWSNIKYVLYSLQYRWFIYDNYESLLLRVYLIPHRT